MKDTSPINRHIGARLRLLREKLGLNQTELGAILHRIGHRLDVARRQLGPGELLDDAGSEGLGSEVRRHRRRGAPPRWCCRGPRRPRSG